MSMTSQPPSPGVPDALTAEHVAAAPVEEVLGRLDSSAAGTVERGGGGAAGALRPQRVRTHHVSALAVLGRQLRNAVLILLAGTAVVSYFLGDSMQALIIAHHPGGQHRPGILQRVPRRAGRR